tara:strand:- start:204 stop:446 length:243 start_codon:yes stop_codon:yes gene_type:complete
MNFNLIIGIACAVAVLMEIPIYQTLLEKTGLDRKPFSCPLCFAFWISLIPFLITTHEWFIFNAIATGVLAELINKELSKS